MSLQSVSAADTMVASAIYNLALKMGGDIGFALLTTILERRIAFHRISLIAYVSDMNEAFLRFKFGLADSSILHHLDPHTAQTKSLANIKHMVDRLATMLAYNDVYVFWHSCSWRSCRWFCFSGDRNGILDPG
jgi:DHA2 family multidrug resistance protein